MPGQAIITLDHLLSRAEGKPFAEQLGRLSSDKKRIEYLAKATAELTGLEGFPAYLTLLFEMDALFLNDDRHLNNIAVLEQGGGMTTALFLITAPLCSPTRGIAPWTSSRRG